VSLPAGPLTEAGLREHVWPRFSRTLMRPGVYLANHSLGRPLDRMGEDLAEFAATWYQRMDEVWSVWQREQTRFTAGIERLVGAAPGTVTQRASAGQALRSVLNSFPVDRAIRVVTTDAEFDSLDFILRAYEGAGRAAVEWVESCRSGEVPLVDTSRVLERVRAGVDLVVVSLVTFGTGQVLSGVAELTGACRRAGALLLLDVYHAAGALPLDLAGLGVDFAVGGSYKYTRGGPGAAWLYVSPEVVGTGRATLDTGWFAKAETFDYRRGEAISRQAGIGGWAESTPPVVATYQARSGLEFTLEVGVDRLRAYSLERQARLREALRSAGVPVFEPSEPLGYGAFSLVPCEGAKAVCERAAARGLTVDSRGQFIRLCPDVLNSAEEFEEAARVLRSCLGGT